jgi:hypothetical protein
MQRQLANGNGLKDGIEQFSLSLAKPTGGNRHQLILS